jgi:hypothetical protein
MFGKLNLSPRCPIPAFSAVTEKICKFAAILTYQIIQRPVLRVPEIKAKKPAGGLVCHQQSVILVNNDDGIPNTVNNRFGVLLASL